MSMLKLNKLFIWCRIKKSYNNNQKKHIHSPQKSIFKHACNLLIFSKLHFSYVKKVPFFAQKSHFALNLYALSKKNLVKG